MSSILQGAWLCLLWRAGGDCDGSTVRQGPGRALLRQPGPQQRLDGHGSLDLASAPEFHYSPPACLPTCLSDWCTVSVTCNTSTRPDPQSLACWADPHQRPLEKHVRRSDYSKQSVSMLKHHNPVSGWALHITHIAFTKTKQTKKMHTSQSFQKMSRTQRLAAPLCGSCCIYAWTSPLALLHTNTDSILPQSQTCKTTTGSLSLSKANCKLVIKLLNWFFFFFLNASFLWIS